MKMYAFGQRAGLRKGLVSLIALLVASLYVVPGGADEYVRTYLLGQSGPGVDRTFDGGETWESIFSPIWVLSLMRSPHEPDAVLVGSDISAQFGLEKIALGRSTDGMDAVSQVFTYEGAQPQLCDEESQVFETCVALLQTKARVVGHGMFPVVRSTYFAPEDPDFSVVVSSDLGLHITEDGRKWYWVCEDIVGIDVRSFTRAANADGSLAWLSGGHGVDTEGSPAPGLYRSTDQGCNWSPVESDIGPHWFDHLDTNPDAPTEVLAATASLAEFDRSDNGIARSDDGGSTWQWTSFPRGPEPTAGLFRSPVDSQTVFAATSTHLYRSTDGGEAWTPVYAAGDGLRLTLVGVDPVVADRAYVRTENAENITHLVAIDHAQAETLHEGIFDSFVVADWTMAPPPPVDETPDTGLDAAVDAPDSPPDASEPDTNTADTAPDTMADDAEADIAPETPSPRRPSDGCDCQQGRGSSTVSWWFIAALVALVCRQGFVRLR